MSGLMLGGINFNIWIFRKTEFWKLCCISSLKVQIPVKSKTFLCIAVRKMVKIFKNYIKIPKKIAVAKQAAAISVFCLFKIQISHLFHKKGWKNFGEFHTNSNVLVIKNQVTKKTAARESRCRSLYLKILHNKGSSKWQFNNTVLWFLNQEFYQHGTKFSKL